MKKFLWIWRGFIVWCSLWLIYELYRLVTEPSILTGFLVIFYIGFIWWGMKRLQKTHEYLDKEEEIRRLYE